MAALLAAAALVPSAPAADALTFSKLPAELSVDRWYPTATTLPSGKVLIAGGADEAERLRSAETFDPATTKFEALANLPATDREEAGSVLLPNGKVLIAGGYGHTEGKENYLETAELFDPASGKFEALANKMTHPRVGPVVALLPSGKVLIAGGTDTATWVATAELFDPASGKFEAIAGTMAVPGYSDASGTLPNGNVVIAGGYNGTEKSLAGAELFSPATGLFSALGPGHLPLEARNEAAHVMLANGNLLVLGGENDHSAKVTLSSVERFNWESSTFEAAGELTQPRVGAAAALLPDGRVLVVGGYDGELKSARYFKTAEVSAVTPAAIATGAASAVTTSGATLNGAATSEAAVSAYFQYGMSTSYGAATPTQPVAASARALTFSAAVAGLTPGTAYHYRTVAVNAGGTVYGADQTFKTASVAPTLAAVGQSHARWRAGSSLAKLSRRLPVGTTFSFTLDQPASVQLAFTQPAAGRKVGKRCVAKSHGNRHKPACRRTLTRGTLTVSAPAGANHLSFAGRLSRTKRLKPGTYTVIITATNAAAQRSAPKRLKFTIVR